MKLTYDIQIYKDMYPIINGINSLNILFTGSHKSFPMRYSLQGKNFLKLFKHIYIALNIMKLTCHSDVQKHVSYAGYHKRFLIY